MFSLPLDPNLLQSCEKGFCFVETFPDSTSVHPLNAIVDNIVRALPVEDDDEMEEEVY